MPASNERALEKAKSLPVDALILDLEDAVAPDAKERPARTPVPRPVGDYGRRELTIRVNGIGTQWHDDDLRAACAAGPDGIVVPKVGSADEVRSLVAAMEAAGAPEHTALWAMVETPAGDARTARRSPPPRTGSTVLVMGTNDLARSCTPSTCPGGQPLLTGLSLCLLAARATGTVILDGVYNDVWDAEGFAAECVQGRQLGFDGKTLIHPGQVERLQRGVRAERGGGRGRRGCWRPGRPAPERGVVTHHGRMVENLHVETAERVLAIDEAIARWRAGERAASALVRNQLDESGQPLRPDARLGECGRPRGGRPRHVGSWGQLQCEKMWASGRANRIADE